MADVKPWIKLRKSEIEKEILLYSINSPSQSIAPTEVVFLAIASP